MRICADRSGFSFGEWRTVIAREELRNELPYCRPFDIVGSTCITSVSGVGAQGGLWQSSKIGRAPKTGPSKREKWS